MEAVRFGRNLRLAREWTSAVAATASRGGSSKSSSSSRSMGGFLRKGPATKAIVVTKKSRSVVPARPDGDGAMARLWDNLHGGGLVGKQPAATSALGADVKQLLQDGAQLKPVLAAVESLLGSEVGSTLGTPGTSVRTSGTDAHADAPIQDKTVSMAMATTMTTAPTERRPGPVKRRSRRNVCPEVREEATPTTTRAAHKRRPKWWGTLTLKRVLA